MSWTGTVQCGHCYSEGHNRRGCPQLKQYIKDNPDSYEARMSSMRKSTYSVRKCSYCDTPGHTRRTCADMKAHKTEWIRHNKKWCKLTDEVLKERGIGIGALVSLNDSQWDSSQNMYINRDRLYVIRGFNLQGMNFEIANDPHGPGSHAIRMFPVARMMEAGQLRVQSLPYHEVVNNLSEFYRERSALSVVGPVECTGSSSYGSDDYWTWLQGELGVSEVFKDRSKWNYPVDSYNDICDLQNM